MINDKFYSPSKSLVNFSNSILKRFDVDCFHPSIPEIDYLFKQKKKIVVMLFDGLSKYNLGKVLPPTSFMLQHAFMDITSIFPPTTVACTNSLLSGRYPIETGWIGWSQYFEKENVCVDVFKNTISGTDEKYKEDLSVKYLGYDNIIKLINNKHGVEKAASIFTSNVVKDGPKSLDQINTHIKCAFKNTDTDFLYVYWDSPDNIMHEFGVSSEEAKQNVISIEQTLKEIVNSNPDKLFVTICDHGLIDVVSIDVASSKRFKEMLKGQLSLEGRCASARVKDEYLNDFIKMFKEEFNDVANHFDIYTAEEAINLKIFGFGKEKANIRSYLGDFIIIAKDVFILYDSSNAAHEPFTAHHAGNMVEEKIIQVTVYNK